MSIYESDYTCDYTCLFTFFEMVYDDDEYESSYIFHLTNEIIDCILYFCNCVDLCFSFS